MPEGVVHSKWLKSMKKETAWKEHPCGEDFYGQGEQWRLSWYVKNQISG